MANKPTKLMQLNKAHIICVCFTTQLSNLQ